jgi:hypothetical protein
MDRKGGVVDTLSKVPDYIGKSGKKWIKSIQNCLEIKPELEEALFQAAHCLDRIEEARKILASETIMAIDRFGQPKQHPATLVERDNKTMFVRLVKEALGDAAPKGHGKGQLENDGFENV